MNPKLTSVITAFRIVLFLLSFIWIVELVNLFTNHSFYIYGVLPRQTEGLPGILLHPFIHGSLQHTILNSIPLLMLGTFTALEGKKVFVRSTLIIIITGGLLLWLFGRGSFHVGASLLIFGYFGFIVANAIYKKTILSVIVGLATIFFYGGLIYGIVPVQGPISWEGHLFGMLGGILAARSANRNSSRRLQTR